MPATNEPRRVVREPVLVVGAGPAGLAVAKCLGDLDVAVRLIDAHGAAGGAYARMYPPIRLSSPAAYLGLPGPPLRTSSPYVSAGQYLDYLQSYASRHSLAVERRRVTGITSVADRYRVEYHGNAPADRYAAVVVATGMCDHPNVPDLPVLARQGAPTPPGPRILHSDNWRGPDALPGRRILIVGGGMRAVEIAEECVDRGLRPIVSVRGRFQRPFSRTLLGLDLRFVVFPLLRRLPIGLVIRRCRSGWRFRGIDHGFNRCVREGAIRLAPGLVELSGRTARFADSSEAIVDVVVLATGYRYEMPFLPAAIPRSSQGHPLVTRSTCREWPGLFIVGVPCALRADSHFIHGMAADAPVIARQVRRHLQLRRGRSATLPAPGNRKSAIVPMP